jgi:DNA polymerase
MPTVYGDIETFSQISLKEHGAHIYAKHKSTGVHFLCYAIDNGEILTWRPGDPVPEPFAHPAGYRFVFHNWTFENSILDHVLIPQHDFKSIPRGQQDCTERLALASAYPAELGLVCEALRLPFKKDPEARKAMLRLSRPLTAKKQKKPEDPAQRERDLTLLLERCKRDVEATRAIHRSQRLRPLLPQERELLELDAVINARGVRANITFLEAVRTLAIQERNAINVRLNELTEGIVTSVDQVARIKDLVNERGHDMASLGKRSVSATLAHNPSGFVRELLELRQQGAYASVRMAKRLLGFADPHDERIRGALRIYGAGPGRWSSPGPQLHNLRRNDAAVPTSMVDALIAGDRAALARFGNPLEVAAGLSRAALCARPGHVLMSADFGAIESRVLSWLSGEEWKLEAYRKFDATGDKAIEPYRAIAAKMLHKDAAAIEPSERQQGKSGELAAGFGGALGAWRRIAGDDGRTDEEVKAIIQQWRNAHPNVRKFWAELALACRVAIRTGQPITVGTAPRPQIVAAFDGEALTLALPSGRAINYPDARLVPNAKFEDGPSDIEFSDNAQGRWRRARGWFGVLVENVVQGTARDLLGAAILRFEKRAMPVVFHCHDEAVIEVPENSISESEVLAILLEPPAWAAGLPLNGKVHSGPLYLEAPATAEPPAAKTGTPDSLPAKVDSAIDAFVASAEPLPATRAVERGAEEDFLASLDATVAPLSDLVSLPIDSSGRVSCPFHDDPNPSCSIYPDHFYCHACGTRGSRLDWLLEVEGMTRAEALNALQDWAPGVAGVPEREQLSVEEKLAFALGIWDAALPLLGTLGERYLAETRGIDASKLPLLIHDALRFHPNCVFGEGRHPCIIALMRDPATDAPVGIHRIGLTQANGTVTKLDRRALGRMGVVKLWPANGADQLVVGEGVETVLAVATRMSLKGAPLVPAWSAVSKGGVGSLPVLGGVERLILLVDNDENGEGQKAAACCRQAWSGRTIVPLMPKQSGWDFNDAILGRKA